MGVPYTKARHGQPGLHRGDASVPPGELLSLYGGQSLLGAPANILQMINVTEMVFLWQRYDWVQNCTPKAALQLSVPIRAGGCVYALHRYIHLYMHLNPKQCSEEVPRLWLWSWDAASAA